MASAVGSLGYVSPVGDVCLLHICYSWESSRDDDTGDATSSGAGMGADLSHKCARGRQLTLGSL